MIRGDHSAAGVDTRLHVNGATDAGRYLVTPVRRAHPQVGNPSGRLWTTRTHTPLWRSGTCHDVLVPTAADPVFSPTDPSPARASTSAPALPVRAELRPGTLVMVRDSSSVQVGLSSDRAVVVTAPARSGPRRLAELLDGLDGGAELGEVAADAGIAHDDLPGVARILVHLAELGHVLLPSPDGDDGAGRLHGAVDVRPAPVRRVHLVGSDQVSRVLRGPLSVNGCRVSVSPTPGLALDPERPPWHRRGAPPDLVILADSVSVDPIISKALDRAGQSHMHVHARDGRVVVGPTVVPGLSPCLRCADLFRADRDPRWPFVAAQLIGRSARVEIPALTAATALVLAEIAATRDPDRRLQTLGATVEINPAEGLWRRRDWPADQRCSCGAAGPVAPLS